MVVVKAEDIKNQKEQDEPENTRNILWCDYTFCGDMCQYDAERDIRKNYTKSYKNSV